MSEKKICPLMSGMVQGDGFNQPYVYYESCLESGCQLWITVYTTEGIRTTGCCYELQPQMVDGQFRV